MAQQQHGRSKELAAVDNIDRFGKSMVLSRKGSFERLLPSNIDADAFMGLAMAALYKAPRTAEAALNNPEAFLMALRQCAGLGLMPGTDEYALTVRKGSVAGITMYQGEIKRMFNFGTVLSVHADVIATGETFIKRDPLPPIHEVKDWGSRDVRVDIMETNPDKPDEFVRYPNLTGVYAYAILNGGACSRVVHMARMEVMRHRAKAEFFEIWDGPFGHSQWLKTAVHELEKWVPKSSAFQAQEARMQMEIAREQRADVTLETPETSGPMSDIPDASTSPTDDVVDGDVVSGETPTTTWPTVREGKK